MTRILTILALAAVALLEWAFPEQPDPPMRRRTYERPFPESWQP